MTRLQRSRNYADYHSVREDPCNCLQDTDCVGRGYIHVEGADACILGMNPRLAFRPWSTLRRSLS